ncbi:MAG: transposase [Marinobacter sp.]|nr:transposase [Marinobacter sp.]
MYFVQQWYALAGEELEDAIYNSQALRNFVGIDLAVESGPGPDATIIAAPPSTKNKAKERDPETRASLLKNAMRSMSWVDSNSRLSDPMRRRRDIIKNTSTPPETLPIQVW